MKGPWTLRFDAGGGAPQDAQMLPALKSWTDFAEPGIRYYSGTATYETTLDVPETCDAIDLGDVRDVAEVFLDEERIGALWHAPYRIELPRKLKPGRHALKVRVTNAWTNRLIGDEKEPDDCVLSKKMLGFGVQMVQSEGVKRDIPHGRAVIAIPEEIRTNKPRKVARYAFSSWRYTLSDKDLRPSGLFGPVKLVTKAVDVKVVQPPVKVIFDTDMLTDFDDVGALACLHALADAGECEILATISSTRGNASVGAVEIINRYYGRSELPVGSPKGMGVMGSRPGAKSKVDPASPLCEKSGTDGGHYKYRKLLADYSGWYRHADADDAPDANEVYRRVLATQPDGSVTICTVGFLTNMRRLLETKPDDISPLDGKALVAKKVKLWVAMACQYPAGKEYNSMWDAESSRIALENWPTPIVFSDFQYGRDCFAGRAVAEMEGDRNPVKDVFAGNIPSREEVKKDPAKWLHRLFGMGGRAAWDETAVLVAVRGTEPYFNVERGTYRMVGTDGADEWAPDAENGPHLRITEKLSKFEVGRVIDELMTRKPRK